MTSTTPSSVRYHPGMGEATVDLIPDDSRYTVVFGPARSALSPAAVETLRERSTPVEQIAHYGIRIYDGRTRQRRDDSVVTLNDEVAVELASPVLHRHTADGEEVYVTRQVLVQFEPEVSTEEIAALLATSGAEIVRNLGYAPNGYLVQAAAGAGGLGAFELADQLRESGRTIFAHPDLVSRRHQRTVTASAPRTRETSRRDRSGPTGDLVSTQWHLERARVTDAWSLTQGSSAITVAIMDDGVDTGHPEFAGKLWNEYSFEDDTADGSPKFSDDSHGTACAGVAVAAGVRAAGAAPDCSLMAIRYPSAVGDSDEAEMFRWAADNGADVISCSWGASDGTGAVDILPAATQVAIQYARSAGRNGKGTPVCWAAGNGYESVDQDGYAANPHVIAIAALNSDGTRADYSDQGEALWVTAPSNGDATQLAITTTDRRGADGYNDGSEGVDADYTNSFGGTSSATPLVAGIIGLMLAANPDLTATEVYGILRDTARRVGTGYDANGHSREHGYGLVDAYEAVRHARDAGGGVTPAPGRPSIVGPSSHDRADGAPSFDLDPAGGGSFFAVEVATDPALLDGGDHGADPGFYGSWQDSAFQSANPYTLPDTVWARMRGAARLHYRAWFSTSSTSWTDVTVTTENADSDQAPSIELAGTSSGDGGGEVPSPTGSPSISGPSSVARTGPAPDFHVDPGAGPASFYAVEVATDSSLFDDASHPLEDGWFGTWTDTSFLSSSVFVLPDAAWQQLAPSATRLFYRAWFSSSATEWVDTVVTTDASASSSAPFVVVEDDGGRRNPGALSTNGRSRDQLVTAAHPAAAGPTTVTRGGAPATFTVTLPPSAASWWLELTSDVTSFGTAPPDFSRTPDTSYVSPRNPADVRSVTVPATVWDRWGVGSRIYYRVATTPAALAEPAYLQDASCSPLLPDAAPWFEVVADTRRPRNSHGTRVTDPDERRWRP